MSQNDHSEEEGKSDMFMTIEQIEGEECCIHSRIT